MPLLIRPRIHSPQSGFSLIWISILLTAGAIVFVSMLPGQDAGDYNNKSIVTMQRLQKIEEATRGFIAANGRRPCPADGQYAVDNANFGVEAATPGTCTGGTPAAPFGPDAGTGNVVGGVVPTKTLGLSDDFAFDEFGRRFTYVVDKRATDDGSCYTLQNYPANNGAGGIQIKDAAGTVTANVMAAYISHGSDGFGAFPMQGSSVANRINTGSSDASQLTNAGVDSGFTYNTTNFTRAKIKKDKTSTFDDLVYYRSDLKNTCCFGSHCAPDVPPPSGFRIDGVAASDYSGYALATGDVNGDGIPDVVIGAYNASPGGRANAGTAYVVFGNASGILPTPFPLSTLNGINGFSMDGDMAGDIVGGAVTVADFNGDGIGDMIIGASRADPNGLTNAGSVYVVFGTASARAANYRLNSGGGLINGTQGFRIDGRVANDNTGYSLATGDFNGDGIKDLLIGAPGMDSGSSGRFYIVHESTGPRPLIIDNGASGYSDSGNWSNYWQDGFCCGEYFNGTTATWQVTGLPSGTYDVAATWAPNGSWSSNTHFSVYDNATLRGGANAN